MSTQPSKELEHFPNPAPQRDYEIHFECPEFTCLCPKTGQPDYATIKVEYIPDAYCVESKSLKLYLGSYRMHGEFHKDCVCRIMKDLVKLLKPKYLRVKGEFMPRGGISFWPVATWSEDNL